jgi:hypothetical protein
MHRRRLCCLLILNYRYLRFLDKTLSFRKLACILSLLPIQTPERPGAALQAIGFVKRYTGPWPSRKWSRYDWFPSIFPSLIQFHLRSFSPSKNYKHRSSHESLEGIQFNRGQGSLPSLGGENITPFNESRMSVALHTTLSLELPIFVLVALGDFEWVLGPGTREEWSQANLLPCLEYTGIVGFQFVIYQMSADWAKEWTGLLNFIDKSLTAEVISRLN